jgi:hypothetical protein
MNKNVKNRLAALAALALPLLCAAESYAQTEWEYIPMNEKSRLSTPNFGNVPSFPGGLAEHPSQVTCREDGPSGIAIRRAPQESNNRIVVVMQGGGGCLNEELCEANPKQFSYDDFMALRGDELNSGIFYRNGTDNPFRDYHQVYIPYCSGDMHAADIPSKSVDEVDTPQKFRGYRNTGLYFDKLIEQLGGVMGRPGAEIMLLGQSAGGFGAAFNLPRFREKVRAVAPNARILFVSESAPLVDASVAAPCFTAAWRDFYQFQDTFLGDCPSCTSANWTAEWHAHLLSKYNDVTQAWIAARLDFVVGIFLRSDIQRAGAPTCEDNGYFTYARLEQGLRAARERMTWASLWRGTKTANYFIDMPGFEAFHMFTTWPYYYTIYGKNFWGRTVRLPEWLSGLYGRNPGLGDYVGLY